MAHKVINLSGFGVKGSKCANSLTWCVDSLCPLDLYPNLLSPQYPHVGTRGTVPYCAGGQLGWVWGRALKSGPVGIRYKGTKD